MSPILRRPVPKTIARRRRDRHHEGAGRAERRAEEQRLGFVPIDSAAAEMSGIIVAASAVFEVTSVANVTSVETPTSIGISPSPKAPACAPITQRRRSTEARPPS